MRVGRYINEVCELFDVTVLTDITVESGTGDEIGVKPCFALGQEGDVDAGLRYATITNWFDTEDELDEFCELNINRFRNAAQDETYTPDAREWK